MTQKVRKWAGMGFAGLGVICFFASYLYQRYPNTCWGYLCAVGVGFALLSALHAISPERHMPKWLVVAVHALAVAGLAFFIAVEAFIVSGADRAVAGTPDAVIVLGAGLDGDQPSLALQSRLDGAIELADALPPSVPIVVTGGQGKNETATEASAMEKYLTERGVDPARVVREDRSTSTAENMRFSLDALETRGWTGESVAVVTNGFHVQRASMLARRAGFRTVYGYGTDLPSYLKPTYYLREFFAFVKSFLFD